MRNAGRDTQGPNFFVIGAQKAGTTRLCELLARHPEVSIPTKEPMYFQSAAEMAIKRDWYRGLFEGCRSRARGDGSTYYSMSGIYPGTAQRIHEFNSEARIIYLVRHPLRRIESAWVQLLSVGHANSFRGFERTLTETPLLLDPSLYWKQLSEYRRFFDDERISIVFFEDFVADETRAVNRCFTSLGLGPTAIEVNDAVGRNIRVGRRHRAPAIDAIRTIPGYEGLKRFVPQRIKTTLSESERFTRPAPTRVDWSPSTLAWAIERVEDDARRFLRHVGRSSDHWTMG